MENLKNHTADRDRGQSMRTEYFIAKFLSRSPVILLTVVFLYSGCGKMSSFKSSWRGSGISGINSLGDTDTYFDTQQSSDSPNMEATDNTNIFDRVSIAANVDATGFSLIGQGNFNNDGFADMVSRNSSNGHILISLLINGRYQSSKVITGAGLDWEAPQIADINSDGRSDLIFRNKDTGAVTAYLMDGVSIASTSSLPKVSLNFDIVASGDLNGDGHADILWRDKNNGTLVLWLLKNGNYSSAVFYEQVPLVWTVVGIGDINGDGHKDIIWRHSSGLVYAWLMTQTKRTSGSSIANVSPEWKTKGVGDIDGDKTSDIVFMNALGTVAVWLMKDNRIDRVIFPGRASPSDYQLQALGDLNKSGKRNFIFRSLTQSGVVAGWVLNSQDKAVYYPVELYSTPKPIDGPLLAFPTAEGFGKNAKGGRGGRVIEVTTLSCSGPGSFVEAINSVGPRTVVFKKGGTIDCSNHQPIYMKNPYLTIAGQTAPGDGILLKGVDLAISADHVIIRHMRIRLGDIFQGSPDSTGALAVIGKSNNVIFDHVSISWGSDDTLGFWEEPTNITVQWSIISEGVACGRKASCHSKGMLQGNSPLNTVSIHHNLIANSADRNPYLQTGLVDLINNVNHNTGGNPTHLHPYWASLKANLVGNYFSKGPNSTAYAPIRLIGQLQSPNLAGSLAYISGNIHPVYRPNNSMPISKVPLTS